MEKKRFCPKCGSQNTKKDGKRYGRQSYRCKMCGHVWVNKLRKTKEEKEKEFMEKLYYLFAERKQTYKELAKDYNLDKNTIKKKIEKYNFEIEENLPIGKEVVLLIDTTYFGSFGVMVFRDAKSKIVYYSKIVDYETNKDYKEGIKYLLDKGVIIRGIVSDGRRGLLGGFGDIPTQMCHFHQKQIITKYITRKPKLEANKELKTIVDTLTYTNKEKFEKDLNEWYEKYKEWINEKGKNKEGKKYYKHKRTRSAYMSLKRHLKYLFVYQEYKDINIPNTTNGLESIFGKYKLKVNLHSGLKKENKIKLIKYLLYKPYNKSYNLAT